MSWAGLGWVGQHKNRVVSRRTGTDSGLVVFSFDSIARVWFLELVPAIGFLLFFCFHSLPAPFLRSDMTFFPRGLFLFCLIFFVFFNARITKVFQEGGQANTFVAVDDDGWMDGVVIVVVIVVVAYGV